MDNEKKYSSEGRVLRPRKKMDASSSNYGEHSNGERPQHRNSGEHRSFGDRPHRPYGDRPQHRSYGHDGEQRPYGERRSFNGDHRPSADGENRGHAPYGERRSFSSNGEHRPYGDRPQRKPYSRDGEQRPYGERRSFNGERRSFGDGERHGFSGGDNEHRGHAAYGEKRSFNGERRSFGDRPQRRPYSRDGEQRPFGEKRSFGRGGHSFQKRPDVQFSERDEAGINKMISRKPQLDSMKYSDNDRVAPEMQEEVRLNKYIANSGVCSRREADTFIQAGVVTVNGEVVTELGTKVNINTDDIRFNGERLKGEAKVYIVMNKPKGYVTTASDPHADRTVMDLLKGCSTRVFPVGRLDKATTGVLMFTNDGEIAERLTHPSYDKKKIYQVILDRELTQEDYDSILSGITLNDGEVKADELEYIDETDHRRLGIEIHSGKNRIVRRIFESFGYDVKALDRVYFAGLTKKGLQKGEWRYLTEGEVNILRMGAYV